jgi:hypothetical protein
MDSKILKFLTSQPGLAFKPTDISLAVGYPMGKNTAKTVNPSLYKLEREGKIRKISNPNGSSPHWVAY